MNPAEVPAQQRALTTDDVLTALRRIELPGARVQGPAYTLVNLDTTFFTETPTIERTLAIVGYRVDVRLAPTDFTWSWGDGTSSVSTTPGRPYPATDVTHAYRRATDAPDRLNLRVTVDYRARYRVDGRTWMDVPEPITVEGPVYPLAVKQAASVLVQP